MHNQVASYYHRNVPLFNEGSAKCALVIIDFTKAYSVIDPEAPLTPLQNVMDKALATTRYLAEQLREKYPHIPQIWVADISIENDREKFLELTRDEVLERYVDMGQRPEDTVILKTKHDAFDGGWDVDKGRGKSLEDRLCELNVGTTLFCGTTITQCVRRTALHAKNLGFNVNCIQEAIVAGIQGGASGRAQTDAIDNLWESGIPVVSAYELMEFFDIETKPLRVQIAALDSRLPPPPPIDNGWIGKLISKCLHT